LYKDNGPSWNDIMQRTTLSLFILLSMLPAAAYSTEQLKLPQVFSDHMVLQRDQSAPIWGWAEPGAPVSIQFQGQTLSATADNTGRWEAVFQPLTASAESAELIVSSGDIKLTMRDVLVGDVWLCSGQSNMEWSVGNSANAEREIANADHPLIRHIKPERNPQTLPQDEFKAAEWTVCGPESVGKYTAVGYYFGRALQHELKVPIGLLNCSWGGTRIEPWTPQIGFREVLQTREIYEEVLRKNPRSLEYQEVALQYLSQIQAWSSSARQAILDQQPITEPLPFPESIKPYTSHQSPTVLYNGMIAPLVPFAIKGSIWYQGESNRWDGMAYLHKTVALVEGWRSVWGIADLPYYYIQIAPYQYGTEPPQVLPEFWLAQAEVEKQLPHTGMVVVSDIGNLQDIHPKNKQDVGRRLANMALARTYGQSGIVDHGPVYQSHQTKGDKLIITFDQVGSGLASRDGQPLTRFEIGSQTQPWTEAQAKITGPDTIELQAEGISQPVVARFAFDKLATPNLMNKEGLPAQTFIAGEIPDWDSLAKHVKESRGYQLVYDLDLTKLGDGVTYDLDRSAEIGAFDRVAYFLELVNHNGDESWVYVSMDAFTDDATKIGVPTSESQASFQQPLTNVNALSNLGVVPAVTGDAGNIEFWPNNYVPRNAAKVRGASAQTYDFGDQISPKVAYGSMQIHLTQRKVTVFALNHWSQGDNADLGIGNNPGQHPDWTFSNAANQYARKRLRILVRPITTG
jgi:sialate O-acetylesterase